MWRDYEAACHCQTQVISGRQVGPTQPEISHSKKPNLGRRGASIIGRVSVGPAPAPLPSWSRQGTFCRWRSLQLLI
ncbi:hypothetical protein L208DRAFT_623179 [Tricholoma matsutake]|nr:hypothetical protein L208DRAFT_623179 [Tricholoma matsutake 945]